MKAHWNQLTDEQRDAVTATQAAVGPEAVRWSATRLVGGKVVLTLFVRTREAEQAMKEDSECVYARRKVIEPDGTVSSSEMVSL